MKRNHLKRISLSLIALLLGQTCVAQQSGVGISSTYTFISNNANQSLTNSINPIVSAVTQLYQTISTVCQAGSNPPKGAYAVTQISLPAIVSSIQNGPNCTVEITFATLSTNNTVPGPLSGATIAIGPSCPNANGNLASCQYTSPICYTNIQNSSYMSQPTNSCVTPISNSQLGIGCCMYSSNPTQALASQMQSNNNAPVPS